MIDSLQRQRVFLLLSLCVGCVITVAGCGNSRVAERTEQARRHLQFARPQAALDALADLERLSAEGHYLKAVALEAIGQRQAAKVEIQLAVDEEPDNPKYQGYQWRLRLFDGDRDAIEPLIDLQRENSSSAALNLFAVFAREARALRATSLGRPRTARAQKDLIVAALKTSLGLAKSLPEFYPELIALAMKYGLSADAERLARELLEQEPDDVEVAIQHIRTLTHSRKIDLAISEARSLFHKDPKNTRLAVLYASILSSADETPERNGAFAELLQKHRFHADVVAYYATYLARNGHIEKATQAIAEAIPVQKEPDRARRLVELAIALLLNARDIAPKERAELLRKQLAQHRQWLTDKSFVLYCEGRILHLEGKHVEALEKMADAVRAYQAAPSEVSPYGELALQWMQRIMADGIVSTQLEKALSAVKALEKQSKKDSAPPSTPTATPIAPFPPDKATPSPPLEPHFTTPNQPSPPTNP